MNDEERDLAAYIVAEVDKAPPLTAGQRALLALAIGINPDGEVKAS